MKEKKNHKIYAKFNHSYLQERKEILYVFVCSGR